MAGGRRAGRTWGKGEAAAPLPTRPHISPQAGVTAASASFTVAAAQEQEEVLPQGNGYYTVIHPDTGVSLSTRKKSAMKP